MSEPSYPNDPEDDEPEDETEEGRDEEDSEEEPRQTLRRPKRGEAKGSGHPHLVIVIGGHRMMGSRNEKKRSRRRASRRG